MLKKKAGRRNRAESVSSNVSGSSDLPHSASEDTFDGAGDGDSDSLDSTYDVVSVQGWGYQHSNDIVQLLNANL